MNLENLFRAAADGRTPEIPMTFILLFILAVVLTARYIKKPKLFAAAAIGMQVIILIWYVSAGTLIKDGLPLYHCRISIWLISLGLLFEKRSKFLVLLSMLGIPISLLVLLMRDMSPYTFPHITNFYYFLGHGMIFLISVSYLDFCFEKITFRETAVYTLVMHLILYFINVFIHTNYSYLMKLPLVNSKILNDFSFPIITVIIISIVTAMQKIFESTKLKELLRIGTEMA